MLPKEGAVLEQMTEHEADCIRSYTTLDKTGAKTLTQAREVLSLDEKALGQIREESEQALESLECFGPLCKAAKEQRAEWDAARLRAPGAPSQASFDWAMSVVRSRSFSGPYTPATFVGSLTALFGAATLALGYALVVGGAGASDTALNALYAILRQDGSGIRSKVLPDTEGSKKSLEVLRTLSSAMGEDGNALCDDVQLLSTIIRLVSEPQVGSGT